MLWSPDYFLLEVIFAWHMLNNSGSGSGVKPESLTEINQNDNISLMFDHVFMYFFFYDLEGTCIMTQF